MGHRLSKIYTRTGDDGYTNFNHERLAKDELIIEALGTVDELNCTLGLVLAQKPVEAQIIEMLTTIQNELFNLGGELYTPDYSVIDQAKIDQLENWLDELNLQLPPLKEFILPRGNNLSVATHFSRAVCRRAERRLVSLHQQTPLKNIFLLKYLNRLSDLLFVLARTFGKENLEAEKLWEHK